MPTPQGARREIDIPTCDGVLTQSAAADRAPLHDQRLISYHGRALSLDVVLIFMSFKISCSALSAFVQGLEYTLRIPKTLLPSLDSVRIPQLELIAPKSVYVALSPSWMFLWSVLQKYCSWGKGHHFCLSSFSYNYVGYARGHVWAIVCVCVAAVSVRAVHNSYCLCHFNFR